ncbi:hypothetical protein HCB26_16290 [Listeria booriae]|uniref:Mga helix-turn-helix domain-containing protein n=1 Tax=Listeria booriae TaxID=1552123 RepID=A0A7X0Z3Q0_9LIST|nr:helix-turn-helix domain-containing protein [Listeria booriae]MBC2168137.1 hypothetical protein [Listeria booriae]
MEKILTKSDYRQMRLLSLLFFRNKIVSKQYAADYLDINKVTLNKDIDAINNLFSKDMLEIKVLKTKWIFLVRDNQTNFASITADMIYNSQAFRIILSTLRDEKRTPTSFAQSEFISKSQLYNKLDELDNLLAENRLILNKTPIEILGNEVDVSFFYFHILDRVYPRSGWLFDEIPLEAIHTYIYKMEQFMDIRLSPIAKTDYAIAISVQLRRAKNGYPLNLTEKQLLYWQETVEVFNIEQMDFSDLEAIFSKKLPLNKKSIIFLSLFLTSFTYTKKESLNKVLAYYEKSRPMRYKAAQELVALATIDAKDLNFVMVSLLGFFGKYTFLGKSAYIIEIEEHENQNKINRIDKQIIEDKLIEVSGYAADLEFIRANMEAILPYVHELLNISTILSQSHEKLHVKVISKNGYTWEEFLKYRIRQHFSEEVLAFSNNDYSTSNVECDLIITDFPMVGEHSIDILTWNSPPTELDFEILREFIK